MKKYLVILLPFLLFMSGCSGVMGPEREIKIENQTDKKQTIILIINENSEHSYTIPANEILYTNIKGGFEVKNELNFRYTYKITAENCISILNAPKVKETVINQLPFEVTLLDNNDEEFSQNVQAASSSEINVYNITHNFCLNDQKQAGEILYIEYNNTKYYFEIKYIKNTIYISSL